MENVVFANMANSMTLCSVIGSRLDNHIIQKATTSTSARYIVLCVSNPKCVSLNYTISSGVCELSVAVSSMYEIRKFATDNSSLLSVDYVHYTSQKTCSLNF